MKTNLKHKNIYMKKKKIVVYFSLFFVKERGVKGVSYFVKVSAKNICFKCSSYWWTFPSDKDKLGFVPHQLTKMRCKNHDHDSSAKLLRIYIFFSLTKINESIFPSKKISKNVLFCYCFWTGVVIAP